MRKIIFNVGLAALFLTVHTATAKPVPAKVTVGSKTSNGYIVSRKNDLITFRISGMSGDVSYPVDAIKAVEFPVKIDEAAFNSMLQNRMHTQLAAMLETALTPFAEYSDLPSNIALYQGVLMELYYKMADYDRTIAYASKLLAYKSDPELQRKATVYQGLSLLGADRLAEAEALFAKQGWGSDLADDASAEDIYMAARLLFMKQEYLQAIETAARIIAFHSQDPDWMRPAELLCAEIYMELARAYDNPDFLDSADEVIREITLLYRDTDEAARAGVLKRRVDALRIEMDAEGN